MMKKGGVYSMEIPFYTTRIVVKEGVITNPTNYFQTEVEAEKFASIVSEAYGYKLNVQLENVKVQVKI